MLESLELRSVGPSPKLDLELKPRMNFLAGDNGLGKSFLLDVAWWALTRTWARQQVFPQRDRELTLAKPSITYRYSARGGPYEYTSIFDRKAESWSVKQGRPAIPGLVIYAQVDGGFSVWDPARNYWRKDAGPIALPPICSRSTRSGTACRTASAPSAKVSSGTGRPGKEKRERPFSS